jgi:hypothetical protein
MSTTLGCFPDGAAVGLASVGLDDVVLHEATVSASATSAATPPIVRRERGLVGSVVGLGMAVTLPASR